MYIYLLAVQDLLTCVNIPISLFFRVMSETVSQAPFLTGRKEAFETAYFIGKIDKLFDCLNVMSICGAKKKRKVFQNPYRSATDFRVKVHTCIHVYMYITVYKLISRGQCCSFYINVWNFDPKPCRLKLRVVFTCPWDTTVTCYACIRFNFCTHSFSRMI